jgi:PAS domain S-box-containing protein
VPNSYQETLGQRADGSTFPMEVMVTEAKIGAETFYTGTFRDITERKQAETTIKESEARYRLLLAASADPIAIYDMVGQTTYVNPAFERIFGWSLAELVGRRLDFVPEEKKVQLQEMLQQIFKESKIEAIETQRLTKSGQKLDVSVSGAIFQDEQGQPLGSFVILHDISQQKRAEKAIKRQNEYLAALHETTLGLMSRLEVSDLLEALIVRAGQLLEMPHGFIYLVEAEGAVFECKVGVGIFSEHIGDQLKPGEGLAGQVWQTGQPLTIADYDAWAGRAAHIAYNLIGAVAGVPLTQNANLTTQATEIIGVIGLASEATSPQTFGQDEIELLSRFAQLASIALDNARLYSAAQQEITEHKQTQTALEKAKEAAEAANRYKSTFLANMSHELRTPLNAIIGYSEMLQEEATEVGQSEFVPDLAKINTAGKHLLTLIDDILDLSKIEAGKVELFLETFDIATVVADIVHTIHPLVEKNQNTLLIRHENNLGLMYADLTKVRQIVFNLLSNACKFTDQGHITLAVERQPGDPSDTILVQVTDTGIGLSPDQVERLFEEFTQADASTTRKYGGTGLGLAISRRFCEMMGGQIAVKSELGQGTTFTIRLPAQVVKPEPTIVPSAPNTESLVREEMWPSPADANRTVLVIDDDPTTRDLMQRFLSKEGFQVITAADGDTGLHIAQQLHPLAITLDVMMPGMDGWSVLTTLKADPDLADIPVIMLTIVSDKNMGYALGASDYLLKPIRRERLVTILEKYRCPPSACQVLIVEE